MRVSLITTERNEVDSIHEFIESAISQSMPPDEIIIADGGSTDGTVEKIQAYIEQGAPIKLVHASGNRSVGRNAATEASSHDIIAVTDVGSRLDKDWLKNITRPFRDNPDAMAVAGFFVPDPQTYFEKVSATLMLQPNDDIDLDTWLPSSRSIAYKKEAWRKAGGYPEHTNFNEDTPFDLALKEQGYKFEDGLSAIVYWRPRPNLREFYRQYYFYAVGDGLDLLHPRHFFTLTAKYIASFVSLLVLIFIYLPAVLVPLTLIGRYLHRRVHESWHKMKGIKTLMLMIILVIVFDVSQILGYWFGYLNRNKLRNSNRLVR